MTTDTTARRHPAADPNPEEQRVDYRTTERLIRAVQDGHIYRSHEHEYVDRRTNRNVSEHVYAIEARGFLALGYDGSIAVTEAGEKWLTRDRHPGPAPKTADVTFQPPAVA